MIYTVVNSIFNII